MAFCAEFGYTVCSRFHMKGQGTGILCATGKNRYGHNIGVKIVFKSVLPPQPWEIVTPDLDKKLFRPQMLNIGTGILLC